MKNKHKLYIVILMILLTSNPSFPWGESKHSIEEVLIHTIHLDKDYVFCGSDASWGTNVFGLFVFDRKNETWTNYSAGNGFPSNYVKGFEKQGESLNVYFWQGILRFSLNNMNYEKVGNYYGGATPHDNILKIGNKTYQIFSDTIVVNDEKKKTVYTPSAELYTKIKANPLDKYIFTHPVFLNNKLYFAYNFSEEYGSSTIGIGSFELRNNSFHFYPSAIFRGFSASTSFIHNSSIIFPTASFPYEGNAGPAVGFVEFSLIDSSFKIWHELPLPDYSLAIFCIKEDSLEYWIGTDKGIFRIAKKSRECIHYGIEKGVMPKDGINMYCCFGDLEGKNQYPVVAELAKGDPVDLLGIYNAWCEIIASCEIRGWVSKSDVKEVIETTGTGKFPKKVKLKSDTKVKVHSSNDVNNLVVFEPVSNPPCEYGYDVVAVAGRNEVFRWYQIRIPNAWIYRDDIIFSISEIK